MSKIPFIFRNYNKIILRKKFELVILNLTHIKYKLLPFDQSPHLLCFSLTNVYMWSRIIMYNIAHVSSMPQIIIYYILVVTITFLICTKKLTILSFTVHNMLQMSMGQSLKLQF